jgi:hypothetical protein
MLESARKRILAALVGAGIVAAGLLTSAGPAQAADGSTISVGLDVTDAVCGLAWGEVTFPDDQHYQEKTGFKSTSVGAVSYTYIESIYIYDDSNSLWASYVVQQSGGLAYRKSWTGQHTDDRPSPGAVSVHVYVAGSYMLADGNLCVTTGWMYGSSS